jgi:rhodanese-related sulfurtransferase
MYVDRIYGKKLKYTSLNRMKQSRMFILLAVLVFFGVFVYYAYQYAVDSPYRISLKNAKQKLKNHEFDVILDVRTDLERETLGVYPGSVHIQSADLEAKMPSMYPNKGIRILAYCNTGHRARMATDKLHKLGYKNSVYISSNHTSLMD